MKAFKRTDRPAAVKRFDPQRYLVMAGQPGDAESLYVPGAFAAVDHAQPHPDAHRGVAAGRDPADRLIDARRAYLTRLYTVSTRIVG